MKAFQRRPFLGGLTLQLTLTPAAMPPKFLADITSEAPDMLAQVESAAPGAGAAPAGAPPGRSWESEYDGARPSGCGAGTQLAVALIIVMAIVGLALFFGLRKPKGAAQAAPSAGRPASGNVEERLRNLKGLHTSGLISDAEFERRRGEILKDL